MWKLLNAELRYTWWVLLAGLVLGLLIILVNEDSLSFMLFIVLLPITQGILTIRAGEKRDRLHVMLPIPLHQVGMVRVGVVLVPILFWETVLLLAASARGPVGLAELRSLIVLFGAMLTIFSVFYILSDVVLVTLGKARMALVLMTFLLAGSVLLSLGLWVAMSQGSSPYVDVASIIDLLSANNPFAGFWGNLLFLAVSLLLASLSVLTFTRHRSFASAKA